ncbi:hypothetical protein NIES204_12850 [Planktothrix agardhii NIES-204]|nr:hypothetical protein NIES204_12850 [Planktothrix agardhii NIES-204]
MFATNPPCRAGLFHFRERICMTSPPTSPLQGEGRKIPNMKSLRDFKILIAPPSLAGKGAGGLGHRGL